jgi:hypothetical protein
VNDRIKANQLLDRHKETHQLSYADTTAALRLTGDYEDNGSAGVGAEIPQESERPWENQSIGMVVYRFTQRSKDGVDQPPPLTLESE